MAYQERPYQLRAIELGRAAMRRGIKRWIFQCPTGGGKAILAGMLSRSVVEKGKRVVFAAHRKELVMQPYDKFIDMGIDKKHLGIIKSGEKSYLNNGGSIQIVSIQSVYKRSLPPADVVFIDECHLARASMYEWLMNEYPNAYIIGLTATPTRLDKKSMGEIFQEIIIVAQPSELIELGFIVAPRMFTVPEGELPDLDGVHHSAGEFKQDELVQRVMTRPVMGSIPQHWGERARGLRTMLFAVTIKHSLALVDLLNGSGIRARHVDGQSRKQDRDKALADLRSGQIDVLCQVGLWIEGLDMPELKCAILARPTESVVILLQSCGRVMRPWQDVQPVILDHAGNFIRLKCLPTSDRHYDLHEEHKTRGDGGGPEKPKVCKKCNEIFPVGAEVCPLCGTPLAKEREVNHIDNVKLVEVSGNSSEASEKAKQIAFNRFWEIAYRDGRDQYWVMRRFTEKYGHPPKEEWVPPTKPIIEYTVTQKKTEKNRLAMIASRQGLGIKWIRERYEGKFGEPIDKLDELERLEAEKPVAEKKPKGEIVDLEF